MRMRTDQWLFATIVGLVSLGLVMVASATALSSWRDQETAEVFHRVSVSPALKQMIIAILAFGVFMGLKRFDYHKLNKPVWAFGAVGIVVILLIAIIFMDSQHRWIRFPGGFNLQASEFAKPALIVFLAFFLVLRNGDVNNRYTLMPVGLTIAAMAAMVVVGDYGTAFVMVAPMAVLLIVSGLKGKYIAAAVGLVVLISATAIAWKPYRLARAILFYDSERKHMATLPWIRDQIAKVPPGFDANYQSRQSIQAVGSGGMLGVGPGASKQKLEFLPEPHNDYIFAVIGEELGLWGCLSVVCGFLLILWRGVRLFWIAPDDFGRYIALGVTTSIVVQAFLNMTVALDMVPSKGLPLPLISAGGSSLLATMASLGLLLSVSDRAVE